VAFSLCPCVGQGLIDGLVRGAGSVSVLALCVAFGVRRARVGRVISAFGRAMAIYCAVAVFRFSREGSVSVRARLSVGLACGCALARTNLCVGEKQSKSLRKPAL